MSVGEGCPRKCLAEYLPTLRIRDSYKIIDTKTMDSRADRCLMINHSLKGLRHELVRQYIVTFSKQDKKHLSYLSQGKICILQYRPFVAECLIIISAIKAEWDQKIFETLGGKIWTNRSESVYPRKGLIRSQGLRKGLIGPWKRWPFWKKELDSHDVRDWLCIVQISQIGHLNKIVRYKT